MRNLYFSNVPAPYRADLCGFLYREMDCELFFEDPGMRGMDIPFHRWALKDLLPLVKEYRPSLVLEYGFDIPVKPAK